MRSDKQFSNIFSVCCCLSQKRYCLSQQWKRSLGNQISFRPGPKNLVVPSTPDFLISFLLPLRSPFCCFFPPTTKKKESFHYHNFWWLPIFDPPKSYPPFTDQTSQIIIQDAVYFVSWSAYPLSLPPWPPRPQNSRPTSAVTEHIAFSLPHSPAQAEPHHTSLC